jgi:hypothetical protein
MRIYVTVPTVLDTAYFSPIRGWRFLVARDGDQAYTAQTYHNFSGSARGRKSLIKREISRPSEIPIGISPQGRHEVHWDAVRVILLHELEARRSTDENSA